MFYWFIKLITYIPFAILFPCIIKGKKNIPKGRAVIICNHLSNIDYIYLFNNIWRKQFVLAKESLFKNRFIGKLFKLCCGIPINRDNPSISSMKKCLEVLKKEKILTIFPEGTRNKKNLELQEFKAGSSLFAIKTGAPIIPIVIKKRPHFFCFNKIIIGEPIYFDETYKGSDGVDRANDVIREKMEMLLKSKK